MNHPVVNMVSILGAIRDLVIQHPHCRGNPIYPIGCRTVRGAFGRFHIATNYFIDIAYSFYLESYFSVPTGGKCKRKMRHGPSHGSGSRTKLELLLLVFGYYHFE
jgi:hypothetical protein